MYWKIKRYIIEEYGVEAKTKREAIEITSEEGDPHTITIIKITGKKTNEKSQ